jgi:AcrR family transcriptional regulator
VDAAIVDAALTLFAEGGVAGASFEQIAQSAGVSRATIYRRWSKREDLIAFALGRLRERAEAPLGDWENRSLNEMLDWLVAEAPRAMLNPFYRRLMAQTIALSGDAARLRAAYWDAIIRPRSAVFLRLIAEAQAAGRLAATTPPALIQDMMAGALMHRMLLDPDQPTEAALRAYLIELLAALGLRPPDTQTEVR